MVASEGSGPEEFSRYELRVFPIEKGRVTTVRLRWQGATHLSAGSASIRLPSRGNASNLARTEVEVVTKSPLRNLYGGEALLSARSSAGQKHRFYAPPLGDLVVQGRPELGAKGATAEVALASLTKDTGVAVVRIQRPSAGRGNAIPAIDRALFLVDVSTSLGAQGQDAAADLVDGVLAQIGGAAEAEVLTFARTTRGILGEFRPATKNVRAALVTGVRGATMQSGSNLEAALKLAQRRIDEQPSRDLGKTLIVIISDGMLPSNLGGDRAADLLGPAIVDTAMVTTAVLVPSDAPLPDVYDGALGRLTQRSSGRIAALRYGEAAGAARELLGSLAQPLALTALEVELSRGAWVGADLAGALHPGSSITGFGFYQGGAPKTVRIRGLRGGKLETLTAKVLRGSEARALANIAVASARAYGMPGEDLAAEESKKALHKAAARMGVVTQGSAGIAVDRTDGFAADRIRLAEKWGMEHYRRLPPPAERTPRRQRFSSFQLRRRGGIEDRGRTGTIDQDMIERRVRAHVVPSVRRCYEKLLRKNHEARGSLNLHFEMARGEVLLAQVEGLSSSLEPMRACTRDAMYAMPVPVVRQGHASEGITIANYPLRFRMAKKGQSSVEPGARPDATDNPLTGLPE